MCSKLVRLNTRVTLRAVSRLVTSSNGVSDVTRRRFVNRNMRLGSTPGVFGSAYYVSFRGPTGRMRSFVHNLSPCPNT